MYLLKYSWGIWLSQKLQARKSSFLEYKNLKKITLKGSRDSKDLSVKVDFVESKRWSREEFLCTFSLTNAVQMFVRFWTLFCQGLHWRGYGRGYMNWRQTMILYLLLHLVRDL